MLNLEHGFYILTIPLLLWMMTEHGIHLRLKVTQWGTHMKDFSGITVHYQILRVPSKEHSELDNMFTEAK